MQQFLVGRSEFVTRLGLGVVVFIAFATFQEGFATSSNINVLLDGFAFAGLAALGIGITIIAGEFDLSIGSMAAVAGVVAVQFADLGLIPAVLIAVAIAATVGVIQGFMIVWLQINSLVFTIGTLIALRGVAFALSGESTITIADLGIANTIRTPIWVFSSFSITTIAIFFAVGSFLAYHRYGREIYAVGGGRNEAQAAGITLYRPLMIAFGISAALAGIAGALVSLKSGSASPHGFENLLLPAATAALIGGTSLQGGKGTALGMAIGALTIRFIVSGLALGGTPFFIESLSLGILLLLVVTFELLFETPQARERWRRWRAKPNETRELSDAPAAG